MRKIKPGTVYEIKLDVEKYVYVCRFDVSLLGLFDVVSEEQMEIETIKNRKIIDYKELLFLDKLNHLPKEKIIRNKWEKIGEIESISDDINIPDLAIYNPWNPVLSHKNCEVIRNGSRIKVTQEEYKKILETGLIYGRIDNFIIYERYITRNIDNIINNKPMDPGGDITTFG